MLVAKGARLSIYASRSQTDAARMIVAAVEEAAQAGNAGHLRAESQEHEVSGETKTPLVSSPFGELAVGALRMVSESHGKTLLAHSRARSA